MNFINACVRSILLLLCCCASGQQLLFDHYSVADGLCSNTVWTIAQDHQGFMWFGTRSGLNRFDGYEFKSFTQRKNDSTALGDSFIRRIQPLPNGDLLIGTENGVYLFNIKTEQFRRVIPELTSGVRDMYQDRSGMIWISTNDDGVVGVKARDTSINIAHHLLQDVNIRAITEGADGTLWVGTFGGGLYQFDQDRKQVRVFLENGAEGLNTNFILSLFTSQEGVVWIGTLSGGLQYFNQSSERFFSFKAIENQNSISDDIVRSIAQRKTGELLIGTEKGLDILNLETGIFVSNRSSNDPYSLSDNAVWSIYVDKSKDIWTGTYFGGVNHVNLHQGRFEYYYPSGQDNSLNGKAVSSFWEDENGMWIGTEDGGLNLLDAKSNSFYQYPFTKDQEKLSYHNIHTLHKKDDHLYVGTFTGGLNVVNLKDGVVRKYISKRGSHGALSSNNIYKIYEDRAGDLWIGTTSGLNRLQNGSDLIQEVDSSIFHESVIYDILEDHRGNLWVATYGFGMFSKDINTGQWQRFNEGIRFISLFQDSERRIWAGTDGFGLYLIQGDSIVPFDTTGELPFHTVYGMLEDGHGNLWMSTNQGIQCLSPDTGQQISFSDWGHIQGRQFNYGAFYKDSSGRFYFGGTNGFNVFHPDTVLKYYEQSDYSLHLTKVELFNREININPNGGILSKAINYTDEITLTHDQSVVSFSYAGLDFVAPKSIQYAYKMEGFENDWNEVGALRRATYTNLSPGEYSFKVRAYHSGDSRNMKYDSLKLTVLPPFYRTTYAYIGYVLVVIVTIVLLRRRTVMRIERKNQLKLEKMKRNEEELFYKRKIEFFTEMAHEIRTPLSLIIAPLEKLLESKNTDSDTLLELSVMAKNSDRLLALINQLLDFRRVESEGYKLRPERVDLINLVRVIYERFAGRAQQNNVKISFSTEASQQEVMVDVEAFNKILSNLIGNALKFARSRVSIGVQLEEENGYFNVTVKDDGIGIPQKDLNHIFERFFKVQSGDYQYNNLGGTGIGLSLARSLVEMHEGTLSVSSKEMKETIFRVRLPMISDEGEVDEPDLIANPDDYQAPKLLIAEDDKELSRFLTNSFRENGFIVYPATNGREALRILADEDIDIVLSDVMMPQMDGIELCRAIRNDISFSQIPVVILTAKSDAEAKTEALKVGADSYFTKPFKFNHIHQTLINFLKSRMQLKLKFSSQPLQDASSITYTSKDEEFVSRIVDLIHENISNNKYSTETLSYDVGISRSGLHKKLKGIAGISPNEFIRLIRLKYAAQLLQTGNHNISEVGYLSGFSSPSYFTKCFHEQFKKTPKEFISETTTPSEA